MSASVTLTCWTCGERWGMDRRRGQYPNRCLECTATETHARRLLRQARTLGLRGQVEHHQRQGYVCIVETPWHEQCVIVRDRTDLEWLLSELHHADQAAAA